MCKNFISILSGSYNWNETEIKQICYRFVSGKIVLFQLYFNALYMWNKWKVGGAVGVAYPSAELICQFANQRGWGKRIVV